MGVQTTLNIPRLPASRKDDLDAATLAAIRKTGVHPIIVNDIYSPHFFRKERIQIWYGGSGSGKSDAKATELLLKCLCQPYCRVMFCRKVFDSIRMSQFQLLKDLIKRYDFDDFFSVTEANMKIVCLLNGNILFARGLDDVDKITSVADITDIWIEEPIDRRGSISSSDFTELNRRLRCPKATNHLHFTFNPISKESWIYDYFFRSNEYEAFCLKTTYQDNYYSPEEIGRQFEVLKTKKPDEYKVYALGEWGSLKQGLVFPEYKIIPEFPTNCQKRGYGLDWGFYPDPTAVIECGIQNRRLILNEVIYETNLTSRTRAEMMTRRGIPKAAKIIADRNPEAIEEMKIQGFWGIVAAAKGPGSVKAGLDQMREFELCITERSKNLKTELDNYSWAVDRKTEQPTGDPIDEFNHALDAGRYWVMECATERKGVYFA